MSKYSILDKVSQHLKGLTRVVIMIHDGLNTECTLLDQKLLLT